MDTETLILHSGQKFVCFVVHFHKKFWFWYQTGIVPEKAYAGIWPLLEISSLNLPYIRAIFQRKLLFWDIFCIHWYLFLLLVVQSNFHIQSVKWFQEDLEGFCPNCKSWSCYLDFLIWFWNNHEQKISTMHFHQLWENEQKL